MNLSWVTILTFYMKWKEISNILNLWIINLVINYVLKHNAYNIVNLDYQINNKLF
jgi:hypothetical protein